MMSLILDEPPRKSENDSPRPFSGGEATVTKASDARSTRRLAIASLVISLLVPGSNLGYQIWHDHFVKVSSDVRTGKIETSLRLLTATVAPQLLKAVDDSLAAALAAKLPEVVRQKLGTAQSALAQLQDAKVIGNLNDLTKTSVEMSKITGAYSDSPEAWKAAATLVSYKSFNMVSPDLRNLDRRLPSCTDGLPSPMRVTSTTDTPTRHTVQMSYGMYENCMFVLDSPEDDRKLNSILSASTPVISFRHCVIVYRGGEVNLILEWKDRPSLLQTSRGAQFVTKISGPAISLVDCLLLFSTARTPPISGKRLTNDLLAQNTSTLQLPYTTGM